MIQAKDLRLGNKVLNQQAEVITIQQILYNTIVYDTQMQINNEENRNGSNVISYTSEVVEVIKEAEYQDLEPIALTPEILVRCGFRNFLREEWIISYGNSHADFEFTHDGLRLRHPTPCRVAIKSLHQLQNFFFAITGEELEVNM